MSASYVRQAVVVVHGMGEQRPLDTLYRFVDTGLEPDASGSRVFYSKPETATGSFEERRLLAPIATLADRDEQTGRKRYQTEFYEYHWSYLMQGNKFSDLWPVLRRTVLQRPTRVPSGLRGVWWLIWLLALAAGITFAFVRPQLVGDDGITLKSVVTGLVGGGLLPTVIVFVVKLLPGKITASFVDVVRYLDTSPRSYAVRRDIRKGLVDMLQALHDPARKYDRIIVVAHSLGGYIAYDGITYLWSTMNKRSAGAKAPVEFAGLDDVEAAASLLPDAPFDRSGLPEVPEADLAAFRAAQRDAWVGLRKQGNPWKVTDFVTAGTPMYFADQLMASVNGRSFIERVKARELPTCPPESEMNPLNNVNKHARFFSWRAGGGRRVLYEGAVVAVVRWTNVYFPVRLGFFGDWFGGPLRSLFGTGIADVELTGNRRGSPGAGPLHNRLAPAVAHSYYFEFPDNGAAGSAAAEIRAGLELDAPWIQALWADDADVDPPEPDAESLDRAEPLTADAIRDSVS
jgi:hypothetical protein